MKKTIDVVGAVIVDDGKILCAQRGPQGQLGGLWEFPGGKIESGETPRAALEREIVEELQCDVKVGDHITTTRHSYDFAVINLSTFWCDLAAGSPVLTEHSAVRWLEPSGLRLLDWAPADIPAVELVEAAFA
ncbi:(deoxy)nucleoside triphosphate pyrophosphohydrolase [Janibacter sp. RAF20_2_2]|uniref:(deoxy)nucleoside triphosphate pyrophosphohydrolase n=1 Tax=unclassified Janibacter TaxID=2649294 RepID=UPI003F92C78E